MFGFLKRLFGGSKQDRDIKALRPLVAKINEEFDKLPELSHDQLRNKTAEFRARIADYLRPIDDRLTELKTTAKSTENIDKKQAIFEDIDRIKKDRDKALEEVLQELLPKAFAVVKETARRFSTNESLTTDTLEFDRELVATLGAKNTFLTIENDKSTWQKSWIAAGNTVTWDMVHYDVQLMGGVVLHQGKVAEMATGEGKTLVATLPAYLNGLAGQGIHVVTVNDYLAKRDSEWMAPLLNFLGLTVDCIDKYQPNSAERRRAYRCDVIYGTNNEFGFDYLRDNMAHSAEEIVQGKYHYAMVDEVDSVLIDDARTPLIISGPTTRDNRNELFTALKRPVEALVEAQKKLANEYLRDAKTKIAAGNTKTDEGGGGLALFRSYRALPKNRALIKYLSEPNIGTVLRNAENYYLGEQGKNMRIADNPLLFVIEEKNRNVELTEKGAAFLGQGSNEADLFVLENISEALLKIDKQKDLDPQERQAHKNAALQRYAAKTERLHALQQLVKAYTLFDKEDEYIVVDGKVKIVDEQTGRVLDGRRYSDGLHQAIEAKENVEIENSTQTYATVTLQNFFRMYHKLAGMTGTAETEAQELWDIYKLDVVVMPTNRPIVRNDKNDLVYKTEGEKFNAIVEEITNLSKAGRPVLVGTTSVQNSEKLSRFLQMRGVAHNVLNAKQHAREAEIVAQAGQTGQVTIATNMAGRGTDIKISADVRAAGGLAIIGTERHDSRRVDRQLRGRAGRQGDVGSSQFYVSLEDKLMRLFGSDRIASLMDRLGHKEGDVLQHGMITKSIERAQKKVEENNFGMRKRLLEYDDVMNIQRNAIYRRRNNALYGERLSIDISDMCYVIAEELVTEYKKTTNYSLFVENCINYFGIEPQIEKSALQQKDVTTCANALHQEAMDSYELKFKNIRSFFMGIMNQIISDPNNTFQRIGLPFTDGIRGLQVNAEIQEALDTDGFSLMSEIERAVSLALIDNAWKEHLRSMEELREQVSSASFEQKDPLVIYKKEAFNLFYAFVARINREVISFLMRGSVPVRNENDEQQIEVMSEEEQAAREEQARRQAEYEEQLRERQAAQEEARQQQIQQAQQVKNQPIQKQQKIDRNDPCPCGSGKKYKSCHGQ
jgi:preprotein translocase subunit SecA